MKFRTHARPYVRTSCYQHALREHDSQNTAEKGSVHSCVEFNYLSIDEDLGARSHSTAYLVDKNRQSSLL